MYYFNGDEQYHPPESKKNITINSNYSCSGSILSSMVPLIAIINKDFIQLTNASELY